MSPAAGVTDQAELVQRHVFAGTAQQVGAARRWMAEVTQPLVSEDIAALAQLCVSELFTNALRYTRSGKPKGTVGIVVAADLQELWVHVHDLGSATELVPCPREASDWIEESGRGLTLVLAVSRVFGTCAVAACEYAGRTGIAAVTGGQCTRFCLDTDRSRMGRPAR